ncbi:MAG: hypothetical protein IJX28_04950 [Clostridia bacterium]|nr:hypothetical protein [Clostridia bacterium]
MVGKLLGSLLLLVAGLGLAHMERLRGKHRLAVLDAWIALLLFIRNQIDCYLRPLEEILSHPHAPSLPYGSRPAAPTLAAWIDASLPDLEPEAQRLLKALAEELGGSYRTEQLRRCDYYLSALQGLRAKQAEGLSARARATTALCICSALGVAVLLW